MGECLHLQWNDQLRLVKCESDKPWRLIYSAVAEAFSVRIQGLRLDCANGGAMAVDLQTEAIISGTAELLEIVVLLTPVVQMQSVVLAGGRKPFFDDLALDKERINREEDF